MTKSFLASKSIWGMVMMAVGFGMNYLGYNVGSELQADLATQIADKIPELMEISGFLVGLWGRITATKSLTL